MRRSLTVFVLPLAAIAIAAPVALANDLTVGGKSNGKTVTVHKGDTFRVRLTENPSTGYGWKITKKPSRAILKYKGTSFKDPKQTTPPTVGAPGKRSFTWKAVGDGTTSVKLKLYPPGRGAKPVNTLTFTVKVR